MHGNKAGGEFIKIAEVARLLSQQASNFSSPYNSLIGDDAAVIDFQELKINLFASDMMVENIHFRTSYFKDADIGYKSMSTNVSDMAAMGGRPVYATVSLGAPSHFSIPDFYTGVRAACEEYGFHIAGGDLSYSELIVISVSMLGATFADPILRSTAMAEDYIFVTGPLGGSSAGLTLLQANQDATGPLVDIHLRPNARVREAEGIALAGATSAIDVSDGLIADLNHICEQSGVGAELEHLPIAVGASLDAAMYGGEDYQLVFSHPNPSKVESTFETLGLDQPYGIGRLRSEPGILLDGKRIEVRGYQHGL